MRAVGSDQLLKLSEAKQSHFLPWKGLNQWLDHPLVWKGV